MRHGSTWFLLCAALLGLALPAAAEAPPTAADGAETREVRWLDPDEPDLRDKAAELGSAAAIYEFVRNELDFVLYDGSRSNSTNTFLNRRGNDVDLASVLIAMLRSQGTPARYATGIVSVSFAELTSWLEIPNVSRASGALYFAGFQNVSNSDRTSFTHAWVRAFVPLRRYRGNDEGSPVDCVATPTACAWVDLDPSFKQRRYRDPAELVDVSDTVLFDYESYYRAEESGYTPPDGLDRREKNPLEVYEEMILEHLHTTPALEGKTLEDVVYEGEIIEERHGILPTSAPFRFDPAAVSTYASVDDHDANPAHLDWSKTVSFTVRFPKHAQLAGLTLSGGAPVPLSALADQNLIVAYESTDFDDPSVPKTLVTRLGDALHATVFTLDDGTFTWSGGSAPLSQPPDVDTPFDVTLTMQGNGTFPPLTAVYPDLALGGHFLVATGGAFSGFAEVRRSAQRLLGAVEQNPVIDNGSGVLYVDQNANGAIDAGEPTLLEDAATQRKLTGGVLAIARDLYYAQVRTQLERLTKLQRTTMPPSGFLGVVSSVHDVQAVDGTAFSVTPVGLLVDMKAITVTPPYKIDEDGTQNPGAFRLGGHIISSLEHEIWQEITGFEAISTMKGIQRTNRDGGVLMALDEGQTQVTIPTAMTNWGFGQTLPSGITSVDLALFSHNIWSPRTTSAGSTKTLSVIRETVTAGESALEKRGWDVGVFQMTNGAGNVYGSQFENLFRFVYDNYTLFQGYPPSTQIQPPHNLAVSILGFSIGGCATYTTTGQAVSGYPGCFAALMNRAELKGYRDYLDFFDKNQGFVVADHLYRDTDLALHIGAQSLAGLRNEIVLGADQNKDGIPDGDKTTEVVIPSIVADGELLDLAVWIQRYLDASGIEFATSYIINLAGGGYVSGSSATVPALSPSYSNAGFTNVAVVSSTNNSPFTSRTGDPIATTTGNVFHDETELRIKGRDGFDYVFTRTYNSAPTQADAAGVPMGHKWSHPYNVRLIARDHDQEPNDPKTPNSDGIVSSITYVDERGGEHLFSHCAANLSRLEGDTASQGGDPWTTGWVEVVCPLGALAAGSHTFTIGAFNNKKTASTESTQITLDDVVVEGTGGGPPILEAHFDSGSESFVYVDDAFSTTQPSYASGSHTPSGGQTGGGLRVDLGGINNTTVLGMSGGWRRTFNLATPTSVTLRYRYKLDLASSYEDDEFSDAMLAVDGGALAFDLAAWRVVPPRGTFDTLDLSQAAAGEYVLRFRNGTEYVFGDADLSQPDAVARLREIRDPYGNQLTLGHTGSNLTSIQDNLGVAGRTGLTLSYFPNGRLQQIADWTGRTWSYTYDPAGNLATATNPLGDTTRYGYALGTSLLTRVEKPEDRDGDGSGDVVTTFDYYENGRGFSNANALGDGETVEYDLFRKRTRITDPRGFVSAHFYDANGELTKVTQPDGGISSFQHTPDGRRWERTDAMGFATQYAYCTARTLDGCAADAGGNVTLERDPLGGSVEYDYALTLFDQVTRVKDRNDAERLLSYHAADDPALGAKRGKLHQIRIAQLGADSNVLLQEFQYNGDGTVRKRIDYLEPGNPTRKRTTTFTHGNSGLELREVLVTGSDGGTRKTTFTYDALARVRTETLERRTSATNPTPLLLTTTYDYDALDQVIRTTDPLGNRTETDYDANGNVIETRYIGVDPVTGVPQPLRIVQKRRYDDADRVVEIEDVFGGVTTFGHDEAGNRVRITDPTGVSQFFEYDERNRVVATTNENGHRSETLYDLDGRVVSEIDANGNRTQYTYDALGRRTSRKDPMGNITTFRYDGQGNPVGVTDGNANADPGNPDLVNALGESTSREFDELGRLTKTIDALDNQTLYEYDLLGNRTKLTDPKLQVTELVYDDLGRLIQIVDPVVETPVDEHESFQYDEADNPIVSTDRKGNTVRVTFDRLNRPVLREYLTSGESEALAYDASGNLESLSNDEVTYTLDYDEKDRLTERTDSRLGRSLSFEYDAADRVVEKTDYQGDVTRSLYDGTGRLVAERNDAFLQVSYHYDPAGRLLNRILSNGAQSDYAYDAASRLTAITNRAADGSAVHSATYGYDATVDIVSAPGVTYAYDPLHRLISADFSNNAYDRSYSYDAVGNRLTETNASGSFDYIYGSGNRLWEIRRSSDNALVHSFDYNDNGSIVAKRDGTGAPIWTLTRDDRDRVIAASGAGFTHAFGYDPRGFRIRKNDSMGTHLFHLQAESLEAVYGSGGALKAKYLRGAIVDEVVNGYLYNGAGKPANYTFHHDQVTSVVALTGHAGTIEQTSAFGPFGETLVETGATSNTLRFTGRESDQGGLYYFRARYYDPAIGRFLSEDPLGFAAGDVNLYTYAGNNPLTVNDPTGGIAMQVAGGIVGGVGGLVFQAGGDLISGSLSSPAEYAGAFVGGVAGGVAATTCGPACAGAAAGFAGNVTKQLISGDGFSVTSLAVDTGFGAVGGKLVGTFLPPAVKTHVSNQTKGAIGEGLSALGLTATGQTIAHSPYPNTVGKSTFDFLLTNGTYVESKFGTSGLSTIQKAAAQVTDVAVHYWTYPTVSGLATAGPAAALGPGELISPVVESAIFPSTPSLGTSALAYPPKPRP